jgi:hypothetical protein
MATNTTGLLSQAVHNLQVLIPNLTALRSMLPAEAQVKEGAAVGLLQAEIGKITATQAEVRQFVTDALPPLQQAKINLDAGTNVNQIVSAITQTTASAATLKQRVEALNADINATKGQIIDLSTSLAPIESQLNAESVRLNAEVQSAQQEVDSTRGQYKYFVGLGFLGLVPLIAVSIALLVQESKVNGLLGRASSMRSQITNLTIFKLSIDSLITDFSDVITKLSGLSNAVYFVAGDNSGVISSLNDTQDDDDTQDDQLLVKIYVTTAISQLQLLEADAS